MALLIIGLLLVIHGADRLRLRPLFPFQYIPAFPADHRDDGREYRHLAAGNYCVGRRIATRSARFCRRRGALGSNITNMVDLRAGGAVRPFTVHSDVHVANCH